MHRDYPRIDYDLCRLRMQPGDVVAFDAPGFVSTLIRWGTWSHVSHVGLITHAEPADDDPHFHRVMVTDSTQIGDRNGVQTNPFGDVLDLYAKRGGRVWWLPLAKDVRARLNEDALGAYLAEVDGAKYDLWQCIKAGVYTLFGRNLTPTAEGSKRVFCSEFAARALERAGAYDWQQNTSLITPAAMVRTPGLYGPEYAQLMGSPMELPGFRGCES